MPPTSKRKGSKSRERFKPADGVGMETDEAMGPPPPGRSLIPRTDSEISGSDVDDGKRFKPDAPINDEDLAKLEAAGGPSERKSRPRGKKPGKNAGVGGGVGERMRKMYELVKTHASGLGDEARWGLIDAVRGYEDIIKELQMENEYLRGQNEVYQRQAVAQQYPLAVPAASSVAGVKGVGAVTSANSGAGPVPVPKVAETWTVVVKGKSGEKPKEVVDKVKSKLPELGVRVHTVGETKDGAVIRCPSAAESRKVANNKGLQEAGLEMSLRDKLGSKIVVQKVQKLLTRDQFMSELYRQNLAHMMTKEVFEKSVRMLSSVWQVGEDLTDVTLECTPRIAEHLKINSVYADWFRFRVRELDPVAACHRCYGFDHRVKNCRFVEDICRLCGQGGHLASSCMNPVHCRNCALRRKPADHPMISMECPVYVGMVARANANH